MKFTVQRENILAQAIRAYKVTPRKHVMPQLNGIHIEAFAKHNALRLTATDLDMSIRVSLHSNVEHSGAVIVDAKLLIEMLTKLPGDKVDIELINENSLRVSSGVTNFSISVLSGAEYPKIEMPLPGETITVANISALLNSTVFAASKESIGATARPQLCCVNLIIDADGIRATASDGYCIVETLGDRDCKGNFTMLISAKAAGTLASLANNRDVFELGVTGEGAGKTASFFDGSLLFTARLVNGEFIDIGNIFSNFSAVTTVKVDVNKLQELVANVAAVATEATQMEISVGNEKLTLRCVTENGRAEASLSVPSAKSSETVFYCSPKRITDYLKTHKGTLTLEFAKTGMLVMRCGNSRYLQVGERKRVIIPKTENALKEKTKKKVKAA